MGRFIAITLLVFSVFAMAAGRLQFPCNSPLRAYPSLSIYFEHCECTYSSNYTKTIHPESSVQVPQSQCESGWAVPGRGFREATGGYECAPFVFECVVCTGKWEDFHICEY